MSRISNERIKVLTLNECNKYSQVLSKESQRMHKHYAQKHL